MFAPQYPTGGEYFSSQRTLSIPSGLTRLFYLTWEDAVWDILEHKNIERNATILLPDFFCGQVATNMQAHGLHCEWYSVDKYLGVIEESLINELKRHKPRLLVLFHAIGITNTLLKSPKWRKDIPDDMILIEDAANRVLNPQEISLINRNHVVIDSLRKTTPLQGSNIYGPSSFLTYSAPRQTSSLLYQAKVYFFWSLYQFFLNAVRIIPAHIWTVIMNRCAEYMMFRGYSSLGKNKEATGGLSLFYERANYIHYKHIFQAKQIQGKRYDRYLKGTIEHMPFYRIPFPDSDYGNLRGYPIGIEQKYSRRILLKLRSQGLVIRPELNDGPWSKKYQMISLPLGPHMTQKEQDSVIDAITNINTAKL